ncbi:uncharacterized protein LOC113511309 [Galleria mellonella]|uniref:Uncharacterized protein LOC113511309 n=1 Tax=Galleria mellonella TaxID=7137 RepID=A0A6J1WBP1_GALME|nr:uncharacterized protein LOC113511309 [Galleria mellonella]
MTFWTILFIALSCFHIVFASKTGPHQSLEQSFLDKLHKPWLRPDLPSDHPRKGEHICKGKLCKTKPNQACDGCQHAVPLDFKDWDEINY